MSQRREVYIRQWRIIGVLNASRRGLTVTRLVEEIGASRATIYRDLKLLTEAGLPVIKETVNSEARYRLDNHLAAPLRFSPHQLAALVIARQRLAPLEGTEVVDELDRLIAQAMARPPLALTFGDHSQPTPTVSAAIETALRQRRRLRFRYHGVKASTARLRRVDPLALHLSDDHLYLAAYDLESAGMRTFKLVRMADVEVLEEHVAPHPEIDTDALFSDAVKAWSGERVQVQIRVPSHLARFAAEWPLVADQTLVATEDGFTTVSAEVAGLIEPMRWVLRWGGDAVVVTPPELRRMVIAEFRRALDAYGQLGGPSGAIDV